MARGALEVDVSTVSYTLGVRLTRHFHTQLTGPLQLRICLLHNNVDHMYAIWTAV